MASSASSRASPWGLVDPKRIRKREHDKMTALEWEDIIDKWKEGNDIIGRLLVSCLPREEVCDGLIADDAV